MILHLGVLDIAYNEPPSKGKAGSSGVQTTGDVATWLENKYGVMAFFVEKHQEDIADAMADAVAGAFETLQMGGPPSSDLYGSGTNAIEALFKNFLTMREMDGQPGVPTLAALKGRSKRFAGGRGPVRPSFIDTGLYQDSFKAWVD
jgi:hypothetical protein